MADLVTVQFKTFRFVDSPDAGISSSKPARDVDICPPSSFVVLKLVIVLKLF